MPNDLTSHESMGSPSEIKDGQSFQNPAVSGFAPDPSVIQVDGTFFLTTSSFHIFPGIPIYTSRDLVSWTQIGNAINRREQLDLSKAVTVSFGLDTGFTMVASGGLWAPTIRHHKGRFYIACTNCCEGGEAHFDYKNFYIWTDDIYSNSWSDPIFVDFKGIDPSLFFDDDGKVYFQAAWELTREAQPSCIIKQMEIDIDTGKPLTELRDIWTGDAQYDTEGPHIYKKDGYYYLLVAEGGTFENHLLSISRSKSVWGPYESYVNNPIMTARNTHEYVQNCGHGELVQDVAGDWWALVLAVRDEGGRCPIGRETFLTPVSWPTGEWPVVSQPRMSFERKSTLEATAMNGSSSQKLARSQPRVDDVYIRDANLEDYTYPSNNSIRLKARATDLSCTSGSTTFVGKRQRHIDFVATARLEIDQAQRDTNMMAGLVVYKDDQRHIGLYYDFANNSICVNETMKHIPEEINERIELDSVPTGIRFRIEGSAERYRLLAQLDGAFKSCVEHDVDAMRMTARDFTGTVIGLSAVESNSPSTHEVQFHDFQILPTGRLSSIE